MTVHAEGLPMCSQNGDLPFRPRHVWAVALLSFMSAPAVFAQDWPRWRGPGGDGVWTDPPKELAETWPDGLQVVWKAEVGPGFSGVAVAGNSVFTLDRQKDQERILCLDRASGDVRWIASYAAPYGKLDYGKGPRSTPTIHEGRVYTLGAVGHLHCLDSATGAVIWKKDLVRDHAAQQPTWGFASSPVIHHGQLLVHAGLRPGGAFAAFDPATGKELWRAGNDPTGYATPVVARRDDGDLLIGWTPEHIVGVSLKTHTVVWKEPYKVTYGVSIATPIVHGDTVVVCGYWEGSKAIRLGSSTDQAKLLWEENRFLRGLMAQPLARDGYAYLLDKRHGVVCFDVATGQKVWSDEALTPRARNPQATLVWLGDSQKALSLNAQGELIQCKLSPKGFQELARTQLVGETWAHPAYAGRSVFARDDKQLVRADLP